MPSFTKVQTGFLEPQGPFTLDPGTASAPGIKFSTSAATGMFSPSTGALAFSTGSTQNALTILSGGNVGIGTTNPLTKLDLVGVDGLGLDIRGRSSDGATQIRFRNNASSANNFYIFSNDNAASEIGSTTSLLFKTNSSNRVYIDSNGHVGIGTVSPNLAGFAGPTFSIGKSANPYSVTELQGSSTSDAIISLIHAYNIAGSSRIAQIAFRRDGANNSGAITFDTYNSGSAGERLRITNSGNVGIGTTNPQGKLSIWHTTGSILKFRTAADFDANFVGHAIDSRNEANTVSTTLLYRGSPHIWWGDAGVNEIVRFTGTGNVGIGTTNPISKLDVRGTLIVNGSTTNYPQTVQVYGYNDLTSTTVNTNPSTTHDGGGGIRIVNSLNTANYGVGIYFDHGSLSSAILSSRIATNTWGTDLRFYTHPTSTNDQFLTFERLRITSEGNVGIGTTNPFQKLHLESTTSPLTLNLKLNKSSTTNDYAEIAFQLWNGATSGTTTFGDSGGTSRPSVVLRALNESGGSAQGAFIVGTFTGGANNSAVTEKFRISSNGNVGIGATNPTTKLHVVGTAQVTSSFRISSNSKNGGTTRATAIETISTDGGTNSPTVYGNNRYGSGKWVLLAAFNSSGNAISSTTNTSAGSTFVFCITDAASNFPA
jgi:hypothetical protein